MARIDYSEPLHMKTPMIHFTTRKHASHTVVTMDGRLACILLAVACVLAGCKTHSASQCVSPRVVGRVVDRSTHQPIADVQVQRVSANENIPPMDPVKGAQLIGQAPAIRTGPDGLFVLDSVRSVALFRKLDWISVSLAFEHPGYEHLETRYSFTTATNTAAGEPVVNAGDVTLTPLAK
jgi:hypothetical protein